MSEIEIPDEIVTAAAEAIEDAAIRRIGRDLGTLHRDDIVRAGLATAVPLLRAQWEAEQRDKPAAASGPLADPSASVSPALVPLPPLETSPDWGGVPRFIAPAVPSTFAAPVTYTATEGFYEPDEDAADVQAAFDAAEKGVTRRPGWSRAEQDGGGR